MVAACGTACGTFCGGVSGDGHQYGATHCAEHREPLCERCLEVMETFARTGDWEGEEGDPDLEGVRITVCHEPNCPETVPVRSCWCWEHLDVCPDAACEHPAHLCEAEVHFCERHA
jgi:hypothetical protein